MRSPDLAGVIAITPARSGCHGWVLATW